MATPFLLYVLSTPRTIPSSTWENFYEDDHLDDLIKNGVATKGSMYKVIPNPMGRKSPDSHTHLVLFETQHRKPFESAGFKSVNNTSDLFPVGSSTPDVSDLECRHYELLEIFNPRGVADAKRSLPFILQTEIEVKDIEAFRQFYREDHIPMMAKHQGYYRAAMYRYLETSVAYGARPDPQPGTIIVVHEWEHFGELGSSVTQEALDTKYAVRMRPTIKVLNARALSLVCTDSSQG